MFTTWKKYDMIVFCDEEFEVIENYGTSGKVQSMDDGSIIDNFYWNFADVKCVLVTNNKE